MSTIYVSIAFENMLKLGERNVKNKYVTQKHFDPVYAFVLSTLRTLFSYYV